MNESSESTAKEGWEEFITSSYVLYLSMAFTMPWVMAAYSLATETDGLSWALLTDPQPWRDFVQEVFQDPGMLLMIIPPVVLYLSISTQLRINKSSPAAMKAFKSASFAGGFILIIVLVRLIFALIN